MGSTLLSGSQLFGLRLSFEVDDVNLAVARQGAAAYERYM